uniref:dolichyl-diphosphooligosaccharide--protein glycotransferase n=1 Tax=Caenorhabditis japonica TaxID=281687 RepID=A0A8R1ET50_CAEJA
MSNYRLFVKNLKQVVQIVDDNTTKFLVGEQMSNIKILNDSTNSLAILVDSNGKFVYIGDVVGAERILEKDEKLSENLKIIDSDGGIAIPGFVDGHSHPVFAGDRVHEFAMKLAGATYMEVQQAGGGIMFTTNKTREASEQELRKDFEDIARKMLKSGTTTLEAKSGYGLNVEAEMKMLQVLATENPEIPLEVSATFCGAHAVPKVSSSGRYSSRLFVSYTSFYCLATILSMQVPFVGFQPVRTSEHMPAFGVFGILQIVALMHYARPRITRQQFMTLFVGGLTILGGLAIVVYFALVWGGYVAPFSGRFYSLWDTGYAKIHIPIIASVSEHQPTTWVSFFFDLHITAAVFPVGLWYCIKKVNDERVFIILYAVSAVYFAGVMVRLMLTLTPAVCVLAGIGFSYTFEKYLKDDETKERSGSTSSNVKDEKLYDKPVKNVKSKTSSEGEENGISSNVRTIIAIILVVFLLMFVVHATYVTSNAYSHPSVVLQSSTQNGDRIIMDDFREAYHWLRENTPDDARVMSWWDYGYQIAGMANRTTLVDNNTWNNSHIALVGKAMSSNESAAYEIMTELDVDYILVIFGGVIGYSGDDINKFLWMVRIAQGEHPKDIREENYFTASGEYSTGVGASETMLNCLMYKMSYYRFGEHELDIIKLVDLTELADM